MHDRARDHEARPARMVSSRQAMLAGLCASLVGIGLARFAYTPLIPALIGANWFKPSAAAYLGAANLAGYLAGAICGRSMAARISAAPILRAMMALAAASFFACAFPLSFSWFFIWRFASGLAGGVLMVLAAPSVLPHVPAARRGLAGGVIFMGIGIGVAASGTLVPLLLRQGLRETWLGLGALALLLTLLAWNGWPRETIISAAPATPHHRPNTATLRALYAEYALNAVGLVPHMIFLVDFVARGLGQGVQVGAEYWVLFGLSAMAGPLVTGHVADRIGFGPALRLAYLLEAFAVALPALRLGQISLIVSTMIVGAFTAGMVPLVLGRVHELLAHHPARQKAAWSAATTSFASFQALAAYGMSFLFAKSGGDYRLLFAVGAGALVLAFAVNLTANVAAAKMQSTDRPAG